MRQIRSISGWRRPGWIWAALCIGILPFGQRRRFRQDGKPGPLRVCGASLTVNTQFWVRFALAVLVFTISSPRAWSTTIDWSSAAGTTAWATGTNWIGSAAPTSDLTTAIARFDKTSYTNQPNAGTTSINGIQIGDGTTATATLTLTNTTLSIGSSGITMFANAGAATLSGTSIKIGASQNWANNSSNLLTISSGVSNIGNITPFTLTLNGSGSGGTTISGVISNGGTTGTTAVTINTTGGVTTLSAVNTFTGQLTVQAGTLSIDTINGSNATGELGKNTLSVILGNTGSVTGTLEYTGVTASSSKKFTMATGGTGAFQVETAGTTLTLSGVIDGGGTLSKTGSGTLLLSGANTYTGGTDINAGTLNVGSSGALNSSGTISFGGGTLQYSAANTTDYSARFSAAASQAYKIDTNSQNVTLATALTSSAGSLTKAGAGTLTLTGTNTFTGVTTVNGGTLLAAGASGSALGSTSGITVNAGGTLQLGASNQINNSATMNLAGGTFAKGNFSEGTASAVGLGAVTLSAAGSHIDFGTGTVGILTFASLNASTFTLAIDNWTGTVYTQGTGSTDRLIFDSDQSSNLSAFSFTGFGTGATEINLGGGFWEVVAVPEASNWISPCLAAFALVGFQFQQSRRRILARRLHERAASPDSRLI